MNTNELNNPEISVVTSMYKSAPFLSEFLNQIYSTLSSLNCSNYELIFVNDGSPDNSLALVLEHKKNDSRIKVIDLSRNFGHHIAFFAGMQNASGNYIFNIDCDLEVSPKVLIDFYQTIKSNQEYDVIYGFQEVRKGNFFEKIFGSIFWKIFNWVADTKIPDNVLTERLMTRNYVQNLVNLPDRNIFLAGMMYWLGFNQLGIPIKKEQRKGKSTYTLKKRIKLMLEAISSFSAYPLRLLFKIGIIITLLSFIVALIIITKKILSPDTILMGYTSLIAVILFSSGMIILSLGLLGIYIEKIFNQVKDRPLYIIKKIY